MLISAAGIFPAKCLSSTPGSIHSSTAGVTLKGEVPVVAKSCLGLVTKLPPVSVPGDGEHVRNQQRAPEHMSDPDSLPCAQLMEGKWTKQGRGDALVSAWHGETRSRLQEKSCLPLKWKEKSQESCRAGVLQGAHYLLQEGAARRFLEDTCPPWGLGSAAWLEAAAMLEQRRWHWEPSQVLRDTNLGHAGEGDTGGCAMGSRRARHGDTTGMGTPSSCMALTPSPNIQVWDLGRKGPKGRYQVVMADTERGTYLGVQVLLWVGTSDGVHSSLVWIRRRRVGRRRVVALGRWDLVGSPRSVPW